MKLHPIPQNRNRLYLFYLLVSNAGVPISYELLSRITPSYETRVNLNFAISQIRPLLTENEYTLLNIRGVGYKAVKMNPKKMTVLKMGEVPNVPDEFRCPICGKNITLDIDEWTEDYDGWKASDAGVHTSCETEPDIMDDGYRAWMDNHFRMPYVDWLPVDRKVYAWLEDNYRFIEKPGKKEGEK